MSLSRDEKLEELRVQLAAREGLQQQLLQAQEALDREAYRLDTTEICLDMAEDEVCRLESLTVAGLMASLLGTKQTKLDARRQECETLRHEQDECARAVEDLARQVAEIREQLAALAGVEAELGAFSASTAGESAAEPLVDGAPAAAGNPKERLERAVESGELLLNQLNGMYGLCNRLRSGRKILPGCGALMSTLASASGKMAARSITGQMSDAVRHFCQELGQLELKPDSAPDSEILAALAQLERFADPGSAALDAQTDAWVEFEVLCRSIVSDLQEKMRG